MFVRARILPTDQSHVRRISMFIFFFRNTQICFFWTAVSTVHCFLFFFLIVRVVISAESHCGGQRRLTFLTSSLRCAATHQCERLCAYWLYEFAMCAYVHKYAVCAHIFYSIILLKFWMVCDMAKKPAIPNPVNRTTLFVYHVFTLMFESLNSLSTRHIDRKIPNITVHRHFAWNILSDQHDTAISRYNQLTIYAHHSYIDSWCLSMYVNGLGDKWWRRLILNVSTITHNT